MANVNITAALPGNHIEPSIAVSTLDPNIMCVVAVEDSSGTALTGFYRSIDGGVTWSTTVLPQAPGYMSAEAPTIDYTFPNTFIVAVHYFNDFMDGTIATYTSLDNGLTFNPPVIAQRGFGVYVHNDEPFICVDRSPSSPFIGNAYVGYTPLYDLALNSAIFFQRSLDQGLSWERPVRISDPRGQLNRAALAVGLAGEVYVGYIQLRTSLPTYAFIRVSLNGGVTFNPPVTRGATFIANTVPVPSPLPVPNYAFRVQTNLSLGTDISAGQFGGFVYAVWNDFRLGYADIFYSRSPDGLLWSQPVSITGAPAGSQNFSPSITVSPTDGTIRVIYYTNRIDGFLLDVFAAESTNGLSFANRRISDVSTNPNGNSPIPSVLIGDYITAATKLPDTLAAVWNDSRLGKQDVIYGN